MTFPAGPRFFLLAWRLLYWAGNHALDEASTMTLNTANAVSMNAGTAAHNADGNKTKHGTVSGDRGDGTFSKTFEEVNGQKVVDKTVTYANGKSKTTERTVTVNADGSKTITHVGANGKTSTVQESVTTNADGTSTITKEKTNAKGVVTDISETRSEVNGEKDVQITRSKGNLIETLDRSIVKDGGVKTVTTTGTGYDGAAISRQTVWTTLA